MVTRCVRVGRRFTFDIVSARHHLKIQLMQKQTIGDDEAIGSADLDISRIQENQVASLDVAVERDGEHVGEVKLRMIFKYETKTIEEQLQSATFHIHGQPPKLKAPIIGGFSPLRTLTGARDQPNPDSEQTPQASRRSSMTALLTSRT